MSKSGYQRKTGQAKTGLCKKCNNANLLAYKHIKNNSKSLRSIEDGYKILIDSVHGGIIPMALPKYIRDMMLKRWPDYDVEESKKVVRPEYKDADDIRNYFGSLADGKHVAKKIDLSNSESAISILKSKLRACRTIGQAIYQAESCLSSLAASTSRPFFMEISALKAQVQELEDAIYAGTDKPIEVAGYVFSIDDIDDNGMCTCPDAGDCFCETCLNFIAVMKKIIKVGDKDGL